MVTTSAPAIVPKLWPESTIVCLANGPSLTPADVDVCRDRARVIAIKDSIRLAPWADVLYGCDRKWWLAHPETAAFQGPKYGLEPVPAREDVTVLRNTGQAGLEHDPSALRTGQNSGFQAINLAVHLGARLIVLLGYDMQPTGGVHHWFGWHSYGQTVPPYRAFLDRFPSLVPPLQALGIRVLNATRQTALTCFDRVSLQDALA